MPLMTRLPFLLLLLPILWISGTAQATTIPQDEQSAVILAYHRIGEDTYPETNLRTEQFHEHVQELINGQYNIIALPAMFEALEQNQKLPPRTIAITFEGAYKSAFTKAIPILNEHNIPYTVFYSADQAGANTGQYMNWQDLEDIERSANGSLGILPSSYIRLTDTSGEETKRLINNAVTAHREHFNKEPIFFSVPFGEWNEALLQTLNNYTFKAILGLESSVFYKEYHSRVLPRFSITENYADPERLNMTLSALPLPITDITPTNPEITYEENTPLIIGFTLDQNLLSHKDQLQCYASGQDKPKLEMIGEDRIELRLMNSDQDERIRVNCTIPEDETHWRWTGFLFTQIIPEPTANEKSTLSNSPAPDELPAPRE